MITKEKKKQKQVSSLRAGVGTSENNASREKMLNPGKLKNKPNVNMWYV